MNSAGYDLIPKEVKTQRNRKRDENKRRKTWRKNQPYDRDSEYHTTKLIVINRQVEKL